ncbi:MAG: acetyl-CoA carboxylase [Actinomycetota bacterium]|nr:acetyl-CoA carboxylase [Actinomycetota bacterium]
MDNKAIKSPLPGTFYRRPGPDVDPFVSEGDQVNAGDVVGLVEIMKSFHEVRADQSGILDRFLVETDDVVEAGQEIAILRE